MTTEQLQASAQLYEHDFYLWILSTADKIRQRDFTDVDWDNLLEELDTLGRSERNALNSRLIVLLMHLLKYRYQPERRSNSWLSTMIEQRIHISQILETSPSLTPTLAEVFIKNYQTARRAAATETSLPVETFPSEPPFSLEETLDLGFFPDGER